MSKGIFNRKDPQVKQDALILTEEQFISKYTEETTADKKVLNSVYKHFAADRERANIIDKVSTAATELVPVASFKGEDGDKVEIKKNPENSATIAEITSAKDTTVLDGEPSEGKEVKTDKPGRTPRMRELIKVHGKDKPAVKKALEAEGFNTSGSGFHSEWNRVSKQGGK